ncbi:hypothetical protein DHEL01_v208509 [Diaporthe helianthi]|uniref:Protein kinase domain-containing protein n=1 Tax=Diaporthe helianthi TaxID=158607 RepID=A0A2P5HS73_DIAHE|nr:hypothetical protein DHEL01_v208509 [Diaporthe helianthi]
MNVCEATILESLGTTMSVVVKVHVNLEPPSPGLTAVLKLYDRRFGTTFRREATGPGRDYELYMHTPSIEAAYCDFIRKGNMDPFLQEVEQENQKSILPVAPRDFLDGSPEGTAKYEAVAWHMCQGYYDGETRAYNKLSDLQGKAIPRLYAHVRLTLPQDCIVPCPPDLLERQEARRYFDVKGILMQHVDGYELSALVESETPPSDPERWQDIIQAAVDRAHEVNCRGVRMRDCSIYNVVVDKHSQEPFIVDLAQCVFLEDMYEEDEGSSADEEAEDDNQQGSEGGSADSLVVDPDPEIRYWDSVGAFNNPHAIGGVIQKLLSREKGIKIRTPNYPDYDAIIAGIHQRRA